MPERVSWCCRHFREAATSPGKAGLSTFTLNSPHGSTFVLHWRSSAHPGEPSVATESPIAFCPWCGARLRDAYAGHLESFLRPELGLFAGGVIEASHRYEHLLEAPEDRVFRVSFTDGDILRLRQWSQIDPSIYGDPDGWCATVVEVVRTSEPKKKRLFRPGSGVDILESDIAEIVDETDGSVVSPS